MRRAALVLALTFGATPAAADRAKPVFAASSVRDGLGGRIELRADRRWSTQSHSGDDSHGRLSRRAMKQFRALLAAAPFDVRVDSAACPSPGVAVTLVDFERDRVVELSPPCKVADDTTDRLSVCLVTLMSGVDGTAACRVP
jgi:hypothetical protein